MYEVPVVITNRVCDIQRKIIAHFQLALVIGDVIFFCIYLFSIFKLLYHNLAVLVLI